MFRRCLIWREMMKFKNDNLKSIVLNERYKANARERIRTCSVNMAFTILRNLIPTDPADRKLSKIETLRLASSYISHLGSILVTGSCEISTASAFRNTSTICTFCVTSAKFKTD